VNPSCREIGCEKKGVGASAGEGKTKGRLGTRKVRTPFNNKNIKQGRREKKGNSSRVIEWTKLKKEENIPKREKRVLSYSYREKLSVERKESPKQKRGICRKEKKKRDSQLFLKRGGRPGGRDPRPRASGRRKRGKESREECFLKERGERCQERY